jgi:hypothetical protein
VLFRSYKIPLKISSNEIEIADKHFLAKDACVQMVYPHPLNAERYVTIIGATSMAGMYSYRQSNEDYDFFIQDGCIPNSRLGRPMNKLYIARGIFDYNWQISDKIIDVGDSELRKNSPVRKVLPDLTTVIENLPQIDLHTYKMLTGKYEIQPGINVIIFVDHDKLMAKGPDGQPVQLIPASETEYYVDAFDIQLDFKRNRNGIVDSITIHENDSDTEAKKIE